MDDSWWEPMCPSQMVLQSESASVKFEAKNSLKVLAIVFYMRYGQIKHMGGFLCSLEVF